MKVQIIIFLLSLIFTIVSANFQQRSARVRTALCTTQTCSKCFKVMLSGHQPVNQKRLCTHLFCLPNCCRNKIAYYHTFHWNLDQAPVLPAMNVQNVYRVPKFFYHFEFYCRKLFFSSYQLKRYKFILPNYWNHYNQNVIAVPKYCIQLPTLLALTFDCSSNF